MEEVTKEEKLENKICQYNKQKSIIFVICLITLPIIAYNIFLIVATIINPEKMPSAFGIKSYVMKSSSMAPTLESGDVIFLKEVLKQDIKPNDIITFVKNDIIITNRVDKIENNKFVTKTDNKTDRGSNSVEYSEIEGCYLFKIPYIGNVVLFMQNKIIIIYVLLIIYSMCISAKRKKVKAELRKEKRINFNNTINDENAKEDKEEVVKE